MNFYSLIRPLLSIALVTICLSGCVGKSRFKADKGMATPFYHQVKYPGETLGAIAKWYTGDSNNWEKLKDSNKGLNPMRIEIGDTILIPKELLTTQELMTKEFNDEEKRILATKNKVIHTEKHEIEDLKTEEVKKELPRSLNDDSEGPAPTTEDLIKSRDDLWRELMGE